MKRYILFVFAAISMMLLASCQKSIENTSGYGTLSFEDMSLDVDETVITKASAADGTYLILILDSEGNEVHRTHYSDVTDNECKIPLKAGTYTLVARSTDEEIPAAAFAKPIYGVSKEFTITAGEETVLGELVCTLQQCKVSVSYSDDFLADVTGNGKTTVTVTEGFPLEYDLTYTPASGSDKAKCVYNHEHGYFAVNDGSTMTVVFSGNVGGKSQKMTKTFTDIKVKQWRQIKFIKKVNEQGGATFDIVIDELIDDSDLFSQVIAEEEVIGEDPDKPKGDGGITLVPDYAAGCDEEITELQNIEIVPLAMDGGRNMSIKLLATVPDGVRKFTVDISSDNKNFVSAVASVQATHLDLINPDPLSVGIFDIVPFTHGKDLIGLKEVRFDLSNAQAALLSFSGTHTFIMNVQDTKGCMKSIEVKMVVK